ncbi:MAG: extracellular solute-binding protein [bacterium]|nr:extracellular solute-binding protein [bacterium]
MSKRNVLSLFVLATILFSVICGPSDVAAKKITLRFMSPESGLTEAWIKLWNDANPDIQIVREDLDHAKWIADSMAGKPADLKNLGSGTEVPFFVKRGMFLDLTDYFKKSSYIKEDDIALEGCSSYRFDGEVSGQGSWYGLPKDYNNVTAITYNKEIFKNAGVPFPSATEPMSYEEFYQLAQKLTDTSGQNVIFGTEVHGNWPFYIASDMAYMIGKKLHSDDYLTMNEDPEIRDIWKYFLRLRQEGISSNSEHPLSGWAGPAFQAGNIAMVQLGYWFGASTAGVEGYEDKFGWAPAPVMEKGGKRVTNNLGATGVVISSRTKYPDEAFKVFEWYMGAEPGLERAETGWGIPPLKSMHGLLPEETEFDKVRKEIALEEMKYMEPPQLSSYVRVDVYAANWNVAKQALLAGDVDLDGAVDMFYEAMNEAFELGKEEIGE